MFEMSGIIMIFTCYTLPSIAMKKIIKKAKALHVQRLRFFIVYLLFVISRRFFLLCFHVCHLQMEC